MSYQNSIEKAPKDRGLQQTQLLSQIQVSILTFLLDSADAKCYFYKILIKDHLTALSALFKPECYQQLHSFGHPMRVGGVIHAYYCPSVSGPIVSQFNRAFRAHQQGKTSALTAALPHFAANSLREQNCFCFCSLVVKSFQCQQVAMSAGARHSPKQFYPLLS